MSELPEKIEPTLLAHSTRLGKPFQWGTCTLVLATKTAFDALTGYGISVKVLLDAETHEEISILDTGSHLICQQPGQATTLSRVVESDLIEEKLSGVEYKRLMYGGWKAEKE